jgi:hypothetical protein
MEAVYKMIEVGELILISIISYIILSVIFWYIIHVALNRWSGPVGEWAQ